MSFDVVHLEKSVDFPEGSKVRVSRGHVVAPFLQRQKKGLRPRRDTTWAVTLIRYAIGIGKM